MVRFYDFSLHHGCACAGTLIAVACANNGGDSDGDGICDDMDDCPNTCLGMSCVAPNEAILSGRNRTILIDKN